MTMRILSSLESMCHTQNLILKTNWDMLIERLNTQILIKVDESLMVRSITCFVCVQRLRTFITNIFCPYYARGTSSVI